jgi:hypothetical protein
MSQGKFEMKIFDKKSFLNFELKIFVLKCWKKIGHRKWKILKKIDFEIWMEIWKKMKYVTKIWNEKKMNFSFLKFEIFSFLKFEMKISIYFFKIGHITKWKWKNNWNEEIIYFIYATEIKLPIIPLYHPYHLCISPYTTCACCGDIQLISTVGSFHTGLFSNSGIGWYARP